MADSAKCLIIGASPISDGSIFKEFNPKDYFVICADGGYDTALEYNIVPDYIVGDFDSVKTKPSPKNQRVKVLPVDKDVTDTMYAALLGLKRGIKQFVLIGCQGGPRHDHTIANYHVMLNIAKKGGTSVMAETESKTFLMRDSRLKITKQNGAIISVFPFGCASCNVSYKGLKYPLRETDLIGGDTLMGVSNQIIADYAEIIVHGGYALVVAYNH